MHPSNSTPNSNDHGSGWTWTAIETENNGIATRHCLRCSPQGQLLLKQELVGYTYAIVARNVDPGRSAEPTPEALEEARSVVPVQMGPNNYTVAPAEPNGLPHLPARVASTVHFLQKPDGSWCVLPKTQSAIPQSWYPKSPQRSQSQPQPQPAPAETLSPPKSTQSTESIQSTKSVQSQSVQETQKPAPQEQSPAKESKVPNPDHPITRSPDHPILLDTMNALENLIQEHLVCTDHQRTVLALWILHTYTCKATYLTPYLNISSPVEESGKSTCMTILRGLCAQPWWAAGASPSGFKNKLLADHPTVLLDNWHTLFRASDKHPMTGFLLSGCHQAPNLNSGNSGDCGNFGNSFCPKAFAGMESLPPSLARHSIPIVLQRRKPQELVKSAMRLLYPQNTQKFISWMRTWAEDQARHHQISENFEKYECQTHLLPGFSPHQQDSSRVLIALADTLGGHWPEKARTALQEIFREQHNREATPLHLLSDIRDAFAHHQNPERLFTTEVLDYLHNLDDRPWYEWSKNGDPLTAQDLSRILRNSFKVGPRALRRGKTERLRGYQRCDFTEKWECYLPDPNSHLSQQNRTLSHCPTSNKEAAEENAVAAVTANVDDRSPDHRITRSPDCKPVDKATSHMKPGKTTFQPGKSTPVSMSQFKADCQKAWTKSTSRLKHFAGKAVGLFTTTRL